MLSEFKKFALRGNVLDLAIGVVIGATFSKIVSSLVDDIIMPLIGILIGGVNFNDLAFQLLNVEVSYGTFIQAIVDFLIIAFAIFIFIKLINKLFAKEEAETEETPEINETEKLLTEIRDLLKTEQQR